MGVFVEDQILCGGVKSRRMRLPGQEIGVFWWGNLREKDHCGDANRGNNIKMDLQEGVGSGGHL